jgi:hypothetical protein
MKRWNKRAVPLLVGAKCGTNQIAVWCPYCRKYHLHGWDHKLRKDTDVEHRASHCNPGTPLWKGYYITVAPKVKGGVDG